MTDQGQGTIVPGQGTPHATSAHTQAGRMGSGAPGNTQGGGRPDEPDALTGAAGWAMGEPEADVWHGDADDETDGAGADDTDDTGDGHDGVGTAEAAHLAHMRVQTRQLLREFLRAVPRREEDATLALVRPDGTTRLLTRAELSAAIDRLRPRQRQIMRLAVEERWSRQRVCEYLRHISIKTFERDQVEALDLLAQL
jgi:hypothetical protein